MLVVTLVAGCGDYTSQASKYLTQGWSEVLGSAYTLERFGEGQVSDSFLQASLEQYAEAMKSTSRSISSLNPPPGARKEHQRQVEAISRARSLVQEGAQNRVDPERAPKVAQKLRDCAQELKA